MRALSALALVLALGACGGSASPSCPAQPMPSATPNANADPALADSFPDTVAGQPLEVATFCVTELDGLGGIETSDEMLDALGVSLEDLTIAAVPPAIGAPGGTFSVGAYRFAGADEDAIRDTFFRLLEDASTELDVDPGIEEVTIGGKDAHRALGLVYYFTDDTMYSVQSADEAKIEEILEALP
ncbi:MAG TPA: hypothetical protein VJ975_05560 [Candidatus Limnocylindria bacterium]|nr:hypothetical protein [Candidatus Limnocylindria bacterium]